MIKIINAIILQLNGVTLTDNGRKVFILIKKSYADDAYAIMVNKSKKLQAYDFHVSIVFILQTSLDSMRNMLYKGIS